MKASYHGRGVDAQRSILHSQSHRLLLVLEGIVFACISVDSEVLTLDSASCSSASLSQPSFVLAPLVSGPSPSLTAEREVFKTTNISAFNGF